MPNFECVLSGARSGSGHGDRHGEGEDHNGAAVGRVDTETLLFGCCMIANTLNIESIFHLDISRRIPKSDQASEALR